MWWIWTYSSIISHTFVYRWPNLTGPVHGEYGRPNPANNFQVWAWPLGWALLVKDNKIKKDRDAYAATWVGPDFGIQWSTPFQNNEFVFLYIKKIIDEEHVWLS